MSAAQQAATEVIRAFVEEQELPMEEGARPGELVVSLPGDNKLRTPCSLIVGERDLSVTAFVIRRPDENAIGVYRYLLRNNLRTPGLAYAIDDSGDVFVTGRVPLAAVDAECVDHLFGVLLQTTDGAFNELLVLGFLESMKREWAWRVSRRESLRNLEPFRDLLEHDSDVADEIDAYLDDEEFVRVDGAAQVLVEADAPTSDAPPGLDGADGTADVEEGTTLPTAGEIAKGWAEGADPEGREN